MEGELHLAVDVAEENGEHGVDEVGFEDAVLLLVGDDVEEAVAYNTG